MIRNCVMLLFASVMMSCASHPEKEVKNGNDSINCIQGAGPGCEELESQIDSLNHEISILKSEAKRNYSETPSHKKNTQKTENTSSSAKNTNKPVKADKPQLKDQD